MKDKELAELCWTGRGVLYQIAKGLEERAKREEKKDEETISGR